ncbi:hypothetical protein ACXU4B_17610 [Dyella soli]|uniref:DUF4386 family protein n=1 Tax=Dyella soli TaxID=522319 RepID=A0A4R0YH57_9GAMM|nr:hypothetical protein [Dyella soli]TCI06386.1 hypothetical protein EZM97_33405 [Dyella soli]
MTTYAESLQHPARHHAVAIQAHGDARLAGLAILASAIVSTATVALDRGASGKTTQEILQSMVQIQSWHQNVHVVAMACICVLLYGYTVLSQRLDLRRTPVLIGLMTYALGSVLMLSATILDGFISTGIAADFVNGTPEAAQAARWMIHVVESIALTDIARVAWVLQSVAAIAWSVALLRDPGTRRVVGCIGLVAGGLPAAMVVAAGAQMDLGIVVGTLLLQAVWNLAAGVLMLRERASA